MQLISFRTALRGALLVGIVGCSSPDLNGPVSADPGQLPWTLTLSAHAILMDTAPPYDTLQLTAVPRTVNGTTLEEVSALNFTSSDSSVRVSSTGLLTARAPTSGVRIIASVVSRGIRIADTAMVTVTAMGTPPQFQQLQLGFQPFEPTTLAAPNEYSISRYGVVYYTGLLVEARDATGTVIPGAAVALRTSDVRQLYFDNTFNDTYVTTDNFVYVDVDITSRAGVRSMVYASATVYGVTMQDSLQIPITDQVVQIFTVMKSTPVGGTAPVFLVQPDTLVVGVGGWVLWANATSSADLLDVVFDDPTAASPDLVAFFSDRQGGDIAPYPGGTTGLFSIVRSRQFSTAGRFHWHSPRFGIQGTVIVR